MPKDTWKNAHKPKIPDCGTGDFGEPETESERAERVLRNLDEIKRDNKMLKKAEAEERAERRAIQHKIELAAERKLEKRKAERGKKRK